MQTPHSYYLNRYLIRGVPKSPVPYKPKPIPKG